MKKIFLILLSILITYNLIGQDKTNVISKKGYTLTVINKDPEFDQSIVKELEETFFKVYLKLVKQFNKNSAKNITFIIDPDYDGVAATSNGKVVYSTQWFRKNPKDIDVVTHEVMHIVQNYGNTKGPLWVTEGIADYARYKFGVANEEANWTLPDVKPEHNYKNAYRITARFFVWLEKRKDKKIIHKLDKVMRDNTYTDNIWLELTGQTVDELWAESVHNPKI